MAIGDVYKVRFCCYTPTQIGLNITHWKTVAEAGVGASLADIALKMNDTFAPLYKPAITGAARYRGVGVTLILPPPATAEITNTVLDGAGTAGVMAAPTQTSGIITIKDGLAGRAHRGRIYIPFPDQISVSPTGGNTLAYEASLNTLLGAFGANQTCGVGGNTTTLQLGIFHRLPVPGNATVVTFLTTPDKFATQRRRGEYGRPNVLPF